MGMDSPSFKAGGSRRRVTLLDFTVGEKMWNHCLEVCFLMRFLSHSSLSWSFDLLLFLLACDLPVLSRAVS
jgi:hypothetical protein